MQHNVLVLNSDYTPMNVQSWQEAISQVLSNKAHVVEEYEEEIHSAYMTIRIPAVIRVNEYVRKPVKELKFSRQNIYARDQFRCQYCNTKCKSNELTFDHVVPRCQGGQTNFLNIVSCCYSCNSKKSGRTPEQAKMRLLKKPVRPKAVPKMEFEFVGRSVPEQWRDFIYWTTDLSDENGD